MLIEQLISRVTYRIILDKKRYLCCRIECDGNVQFSMSREWGFPIRPHTELWEKIYKEVKNYYEESLKY